MIGDRSGEDQAFARFVQSLVSLRRQNWDLFADGKRTWHTSAEYPGLLGITVEAGPRKLQLFINRDEKPLPAAVWKPLAGLKPATPVQNLLTESPLEPQNTLPAYGVVMF